MHLGCFHIPEGMKVDHMVGYEDLDEANQQKAKATLSRAQEEAARLEAAGGASSASPKRSKSGETAAVRRLLQASIHHCLTRAPHRGAAPAGTPRPRRRCTTCTRATRGSN